MSAQGRTQQRRTPWDEARYATPRRRDLRFRLPAARAGDWNAHGRHVSHFFNALSLCFPPGERFFIDSVRQFREPADSAGLAAAVRGFIGQEAMHSREHARYNRALQDYGLPAQALERRVGQALGALRRAAPPAWRLSYTIALEHFTAILADRLLGDPRLLAGAEPQYAALWRWHAVEETEHKAVAFDVWSRTQGRGLGAHLLRCGGMLAASAVFCASVLTATAVLAEADPATRRDTRGYLRLARFLLQRPGLVSSGWQQWLAYFGRSFHPWDHDNRKLLPPELDDTTLLLSAA